MLYMLELILVFLTCTVGSLIGTVIAIKIKKVSEIIHNENGHYSEDEQDGRITLHSGNTL